MRLPFPSGESWILTRGYNIASHIDYGGDTSDDRYAVDFIESGCNSIGKPILAAAEGVVAVPTPNSGGYGNAVLINHGECKTRYAHLDSVLVQDGQYVFQGQQIGVVGNTGNVSGSACSLSPGMHLHFALYCNGVGVKPEPISGYANLVAGNQYLSNNTLYNPTASYTILPNPTTCVHYTQDSSGNPVSCLPLSNRFGAGLSNDGNDSDPLVPFYDFYETESPYTAIQLRVRDQLVRIRVVGHRETDNGGEESRGEWVEETNWINVNWDPAWSSVSNGTLVIYKHVMPNITIHNALANSQPGQVWTKWRFEVFVQTGGISWPSQPSFEFDYRIKRIPLGGIPSYTVDTGLSNLAYNPQGGALRLASVPGATDGTRCLTGYLNGDYYYCSSGCQCQAGEGHCESDTECASGLVCNPAQGGRYGLPSGVGVCEVATSGSNNPPSGTNCLENSSTGTNLCTSSYLGATSTLPGIYGLDSTSLFHLQTSGSDANLNPSSTGFGQAGTAILCEGNATYNQINNQYECIPPTTIYAGWPEYYLYFQIHNVSPGDIYTYYEVYYNGAKRHDLSFLTGPYTVPTTGGGQGQLHHRVSLEHPLPGNYTILARSLHTATNQVRELGAVSLTAIESTDPCTADDWSCGEYDRCNYLGTQSRDCQKLDVLCVDTMGLAPTETSTCTPMRSCTVADNDWVCSAYPLECGVDNTHNRVCELVNTETCTQDPRVSPTETSTCTAPTLDPSITYASCAAGYEKTTNPDYAIPGMVGCGGKTEGRNQCRANGFCGGNSHMCTGDEYVYYRGNTPIPAIGRYWLASCVHDSPEALVTLPTNEICSYNCQNIASTMYFEYQWHEDGTSFGHADPHAVAGVELWPGSGRRRLGSSSGPLAYASVQPTSLAENGAMCCPGTTPLPAASQANVQVDAGVADSGIPAVATCAPGHPTEAIPGTSMMIGCSTLNWSNGYNQCDAPVSCGDNSHMCTWSEFNHYSGGSQVYTQERFWLASCVTDGDDNPGTPTDQICSSCAQVSNPPHVHDQWQEGGVAFNAPNTNSYTGVEIWGPNGDPRHLGTLTTSAVYGSAQGTYVDYNGALCCYGATPQIFTSSDGGITDSGSLDSGIATVDSGSVDSGEAPDTGTPDTGVEPDSGAAAPLAPATCASGYNTEDVYPDSMMVGCATSSWSTNFDQCSAHVSCGNGSHMCTWTEFLHYRGPTPIPTTGRYWLASCVVDGNDVSGIPSDQICSTCSYVSNPPHVYDQWPGTGGSYNAPDANSVTGVEIWSGNELRYLGTPSAPLVYGCAQGTYITDNGALCCPGETPQAVP